MKLLIATVVLVVIPSVAQASPKAGEMRDYCSYNLSIIAGEKQSDPDKALTSAGFCSGYVAAYLEYSDGLPVHLDKTDVKLHIAPGVTTGQAVRVFVKYVNEHPELENKDGIGILFEALFKAKLIGMEKIEAAPASVTQ